MISTKLIAIILAVFIAIMVFFSSMFVVNEGQQAIISGLGGYHYGTSQPAKISSPGLHFKLPFIGSVQRFDSRMQLIVVDNVPIITQDKKTLLVDYYIQWRITDLATYLTATSDNKISMVQLLTEQIDDELQRESAKYDFSTVITDLDANIIPSLVQQPKLKTLGVALIDLGIKTIELPDQDKSALFNHMRVRWERTATENRAAGQSMGEVIRAKADAKAALMLVNAKQQAVKLRAQGDGVAAKLYATAYCQYPDFYRFYRSLAAYQKIFSTKDILVLSTKDNFFKYFNYPQILITVAKQT